MKCLETRTRRGMKWRRYRLEDGRILTTYELPCNVVNNLGLKRVDVAMDRFKRGEAVRSLSHRIDDLLLKGWKPEAVANEVGVTARTAQRRRSMLASKQAFGEV